MWAHHDGSGLYVSPSRHTLGGTAHLRVRVAAPHPVSVSVRTVEDGEPRFTPAELAEEKHGEQWFEAEITVCNPVTRYRFLITSATPHTYAWLNGTGLNYRDVSDAHDFRVTSHDGAPRWAEESVLYQIFPDRFATTGAAQAESRELPEWALPREWDDPVAPLWPETSNEYFGGDLPGITTHLDYLQGLGVTGIYLTPIFPGGSNHRYDARTFTEVDPLLGGNDALAELSQALHSRGMHIVGDLTTNHTGNTHEWFTRALADPESEERSFYYWTESGYASWLGIDTLPKLNYHSPELWDRFVRGPKSIVGMWLREPYNLDGWRIDVANMTGRRGSDDFAHEVARAVRDTSTEINPDALVIGEHFHDATGDVDGDGWHANMNYTGFTRPLWTWLVAEESELPFIGMPATIPSLPGPEVVASMNDFLAQIPWQVQQAQWNMLGSHDTARIRTVVGSDDRLIVAAAALFTLPGTPVIFSGDELGFEGTNGDHSRTTIPWDRIDEVNPAIRSAYTALAHLRRTTPELVEGSKMWVLIDDDALAFVRETATSRVLVVLTRASYAGHVHVPGAPIANDPGVLYCAGDVTAAPSDCAASGRGCAPGPVLAIAAGGPSVFIAEV